jgi:hypothetical protein
MNDLDPLPELSPVKDQLSRIVETLTEWQARLVLSFTKTVFGSETSAMGERLKEGKN